jgi:hypothetical protein
MLWTEAEIAREREHDRMAIETILIRAAVADIAFGGAKLREALKELRGE